MTAEESILKIKRRLEKVMKGGKNSEPTIDLLRKLEEFPMTLELLTKTRIGMTVNALRKTVGDGAAAAAAKALIKEWKKFVVVSSSQSQADGGAGAPAAAAPGGGGGGGDGDANTSVSTESGADEAKGDKSGDGKGDSAAATKKGKSEVSFPAKHETMDATRVKCCEVLTNALKADLDLDGVTATPEEMAAELEQAIFDEFKNTEVKYKNRIRSRAMNLKDSRNPTLRYNFMRGILSAKKLATMTPEEMASDEMKELRQKFIKEGIDGAQLSTNVGTKTDLLKCGRCKQRNCTYSQAQTRSADEPMTTFVLCNACGNRWKFC